MMGTASRVSCQHLLVVAALTLTVVVVVIAESEHNINLDGSQYIEKSLLADRLNTQVLKLVMAFNTTVSSGLLLYATGTSGDYVALELVHGKLRYKSFWLFL